MTTTTVALAWIGGVPLAWGGLLALAHWGRYEPGSTEKMLATGVVWPAIVALFSLSGVVLALFAIWYGFLRIFDHALGNERAPFWKWIEGRTE